MSKESLTVVLPVHNREAHLRHDVECLLDLAGELTDSFSVMIVDDGSTDDTYEAASELAARFPQVCVIRRSIRGGLGPAMEAVRTRIRSDVVIAYDGVSPLRASEVRRLWQRYQLMVTSGTKDADQPDSYSARDLAEITRLHHALECVHQRVSGFQFVSPQVDAAMPNEAAESPGCESIESAQVNGPRNRSNHVGVIPPLPRPKLLETVARFALGE